MRATRLGRTMVVAGFVLVLAAVPAGLPGPTGTPAVAQEFGGFGGYQLSAHGMGLTAAPVVPSLLPVDAPAEGTLALATATLSSGGTGYGLASSVFPGPLLANLRPLLETGAGVEVPIPDYPVMVESREHEGTATSRVPGMTMSSNVNPEEAVVTADLGGFTLPGIIDVGQVRTVSRATLEPGLAISVARTEVAGIDILAGAIHIESVVTEATATSDGATSTCEGTVRIGGATLNGRTVAIDDQGVHGEGDSVLPFVDLNDLILGVLDELGVRIRALGTLEGCEGARGDVTSRGLHLSLPLPAAGPIPPGGTLEMVVGVASASANASPPFTFEPPAPPTTAGPTPAVASPPPPTPPAAAPAPPITDTVAAPGPTTASQPASPVAQFRPAAAQYTFGGVPAGLVLGLMLLAIPGARAIRRYLGRVMALVG